MFRVQNNVPDVYINQSRDFQLFARLYDLVFQSSRFSIDSLEQVSDTMRCNDALLPLIATKVGFFTDLNLTSRADRLILSAFPYIISYKGSFRGIELVANVFERIMNTNVTVIQDELDKSHVTISFEQYTPDLSLLYPLLEYIRPTGMFIDYTVRTDLDVSTDIYTSYDKVKFTTVPGTSSDFVVKDSADKYVSNVGYSKLHKDTIDDSTTSNESTPQEET